MAYQYLECRTCYRSWSRWGTRGRPPVNCPSCQANIQKPDPWDYKPRKPRKPTTTLVTTDGGKVEAGIRDTNDCTVRALATATNTPYAQAHEFLRKAGRRQGKGVVFHTVLWKAGNQALGHKFELQHLVKSRGIRTAMLRNPQLRYGTWILHTRRHVATLRNGVLMDSFDSSRKDILEAWKVTPV